MQHELKIDRAMYYEVVMGNKPFEYRKCDRDFKVGDTLLLRETVHTAKEMAAGMPLEYTGNQTIKTISFILDGRDYPTLGDYAILGFNDVTAQL